MKKEKCKLCGKYEGRMKEVKIRKSENKLLMEKFFCVDVPVIHYWKWCTVKNNWCKNVAGSCGEILVKEEKKLELENKQAFDGE